MTKKGYTKIKNYLITSSELDAIEFRILTFLISLQKDDSCFPSANTISSSLAISRRSVFQKLDSLESKGFILREKRYFRTGRQSSNRYLINEDVISKKIEDMTNSNVSENVEEKITEELLKLSEYDWVNEEDR